ncbi:flagellar biosynthetic protein FliR [Roseospirillum parvum]|uniref:Flagellar biosynthetic protein FliR n=1 Tax=Roseospirillum parvum TaxID=83401 RepID=A0A1G8DH04_9PROT|nr:flagellar biosynthetic protein FliR [Roseospirillum parvum]SDH57017.1 flagellar biosynthetic protein FliR [Roseospirillum parvum]
MLDDFLTLNVFHFILVFARLGSTMMFLPGFSATYVTMQARLSLALAITIAVLPLLSPLLPAMPDSAAELVRLFILEITIGIFLGSLVNVITTALHLAGTVIGITGGLMNAMVFDPITAQQGAMVIGLLSMISLVLIFTLGLHGLMLKAVIDSYGLFVPGQVPMSGDMIAMLRDVMNDAAHVGLRLASPFIVFAMVFEVAMGILVRLAPQWNIFFVALPLKLTLGLGLLMIVLPAMMLSYLSYFENVLEGFLAG